MQYRIGRYSKSFIVILIGLLNLLQVKVYQQSSYFYVIKVDTLDKLVDINTVSAIIVLSDIIDIVIIERYKSQQTIAVIIAIALEPSITESSIESSIESSVESSIVIQYKSVTSLDLFALLRIPLLIYLLLLLLLLGQLWLQQLYTVPRCSPYGSSDPRASVAYLNGLAK